MNPTPEFAKAFVAAQSELTGVAKDGKNPAFRSRYATLESVIDTARPVLSRHKLAFMQMPGALTPEGLSLRTIIMHESGGCVWHDFTVPMPKKDPQGAGSAITYACRYALMAALGMPPVDDDGEASMPSRNERNEHPNPAPLSRASSPTAESPAAVGGELTIEATKPPRGIDADLWATVVSRASGGIEALGAYWNNDLTTSEKAILAAHKEALKTFAANMKRAA